MDCVLGYHLTPFTCGIARFNHVLGQHLGVPVVSLFAPDADGARHVLLSIKTSEFTAEDQEQLPRWLAARPAGQVLDLFLHGFTDTPLEAALMAAAATVYAGNRELAATLRARHPRVVEAWCPGALLHEQPFDAAEITVFSFGMAHKVKPERYRRLKALLDRSGKSYAVNLSTAQHEGTSLNDAFMHAADGMSQIFGDKVRFLGFLSDEALFNHLREATFVAAFFPDGVRANNTSINAAMQHGAVVITNLDAHSPPEFRHGHSIIDVDRLDALPLDPALLAGIGAGAREAARVYGWDTLAALLRSGGEAT